MVVTSGVPRDQDERKALEALIVDDDDLGKLEALIAEFNIFEAIGAVSRNRRKDPMNLLDAKAAFPLLKAQQLVSPLAQTTERFRDKHLLQTHHGVPSHVKLLPHAKERAEERWQTQPRVPANTLILPYAGEKGAKVNRAIESTIEAMLNANHEAFYLELHRGTHYDKAMTVYRNGSKTAEHVVFLLYRNNIGVVHFERADNLQSGIPWTTPFSPAIIVDPEGDASMPKEQ